MQFITGRFNPLLDQDMELPAIETKYSGTDEVAILQFQ